MKTRQFPRSIRVAIAIGALGALVAAAPARALDQDAWLQQQLSTSDGGSYTPFVPSEKSASAYKSDDAQSVWVQRQLTISDGSAPIDRGDAEAEYAHTPRTATVSVK